MSATSLASPTASAVTSGNIIAVANAAQLTSALRIAKGGDTILLGAGNYGDVLIKWYNPAGTVTVRSADVANEAVFRSLRIANSSGYSFADIDVRSVLGNNGDAGAWISESSRISLDRMSFAGSLSVAYTWSLTLLGRRQRPKQCGGMLSRRPTRATVW